MSRRFITLVLAAATAITFASQQARAAQPEDVAKIVGGVALLYFLSEALEAREDDRDKAKKKAKKKKKAPVVAHSMPRYGFHDGRRFDGRGHGYGKRRDRARTLPAQCRREFTNHNGRAQVFYGARCLQRYGRDYIALPNRCSVSLRVGQRTRTGYSERCLDRFGYKTPRR